jgi:hypothetical protein
MIDAINRYTTPAEALAAFSAAGMTWTDDDGVEHIKTATIEFAVCEWGEKFTLTDPGDPTDPLNFPPVWTGDGFHWVVYRDLVNEEIPPELLTGVVWSSLMRDTNAEPVPRPTDGSVPNQFWL